MSMTDPVADLLTRIRNGLQAGKRWVDIPASNLKKRILYILREEHYIKDFIVVNHPVKKQLRVFLPEDRFGFSSIDRQLDLSYSRLTNSFLPARLGDAGDFTLQSQFTETESAQSELSQKRSGSAAL